MVLSQVSGAPRYFEGVLLRAIELSGGQNAVVKPMRGEGPGYSYRCSWTQK